MKNILLILTGGTIGSRINEKGNISPSLEPLVLDFAKSKLKNTKFTVREPLNVLSENMTLSDREVLIKDILSTDLSLFDGIIITHGSDTVSYTAALLSMALRHLDIPVLLVCANKILSDPSSNGIRNFLDSVSFIGEGTVKRGVFVIYDKTVYLGSRILAADPFCDRFSSFDGVSFGSIENGVFVPNLSDLNPSILDINRQRSQIFSLKDTLIDSVALIPYSPAAMLGRFDTESLSAVLIFGYHSGTVNEREILNFANRCQKTGTDIYLASFKDESLPIYESLSEILKVDIVGRIFNTSPESALAKIQLAYSVNSDLLNRNLFFEKI